LQVPPTEGGSLMETPVVGWRQSLYKELSQMNPRLNRFNSKH